MSSVSQPTQNVVPIEENGTNAQLISLLHQIKVALSRVVFYTFAGEELKLKITRFT